MEMNREQMETRLDALCAHLEELLSRKEAFEADNARFLRANAARRLERTVAAANPVQEEYKALQAKCQKAKAVGDERLEIHYANMVRYCKGPFERSIAAVNAAMEAGSFEELGEALEALMPDEELEALRQALIAYSEDYQNTLAECQRLDKELYGEEAGEEEAQAE